MISPVNQGVIVVHADILSADGALLDWGRWGEVRKFIENIFYRFNVVV